MKYNVLLLDSAMLPINTISWQKAMVLWFKQKVTVLAHQDSEIAGEMWTFNVPSVIQLKGYVRKNIDKHIRFSRLNIFSRDQFTCQYCANHFQAKRLTLEHIHPRSRGGPTNWTNVVAACFPCNQKKKGRTPEEAGMKLLKKPVKPASLHYTFVPYGQAVPEEWKPYLDWFISSRG